MLSVMEEAIKLLEKHIGGTNKFFEPVTAETPAVDRDDPELNVNSKLSYKIFGYYKFFGYK